MKAISLFFALSLCSFSLTADTLYDSVETLPFDPTGYYATEQSLDKIFRAQEIKTVIELGSWAGSSTRFFARRVGENGIVYAVDHWFGSPNHRGEMTDPRLDYIYQLFLSNIRHAGIEERVVPMRMSTDEAIKSIRKDVRADLIYIDTARDTARVYTDIVNWYPLLNKEGVLCGTEWREPAVQSAVQRAAQELGKMIETDRKGYFWALR